MKERNQTTNGVSKVTYALAGGSSRFYRLSKERRAALRDHAKELREAGADFVTASLRTDVKDGFVYLITHPSWPQFVKIGCAINPESRLKDYQTYCPRRAFRLEHYVYTKDRRELEEIMHSIFAYERVEGEWFRVELKIAKRVLDDQYKFEHDEAA